MVFENNDEAIPDGLSLDDEPPVDLTLLASGRRRVGAGAYADAYADLAARIEQAAAPELARRARLASGVVDFLPVLARSLRPALVAAAAALLLSAGLSLGETAGEEELVASTSADFVATQLLRDAADERALDARALAMSNATWVAQQRAPDTDALAAAIGLEWEP